jgi:hypothetical protein
MSVARVFLKKYRILKDGRYPNTIMPAIAESQINLYRIFWLRARMEWKTPNLPKL